MNPEKNNVVLIHLDRPRELRFSNKAIKEYSALTQTSMKDLDDSLLEFENQEAAAWILLKHDSIRCSEKILTREEVADLLDKHVTPGKLFKLINQALAAAFKDDESAQSQQAEGDPQTAVGTGEPS